MAGYLILLLAIGWGQDDRVERRRLWLGLGMCFLALAIEIQLSSSIQSLPTSEHEAFQPDLWQGVTLLKNIWTWCPDVVILFAVTLLVWSARWMTELVANAPDSGHQGLAIRLWQGGRLATQKYRKTFFGWIVVFGMLLAFALVYSIPRYLVLPLTFLILIFGRVTLIPGRSRRYACLGLVAFILFNFFNLDGRFFPSLESSEPFDRRTGAILERSREYLADHRANIRLVELLSSQYREWAIVAPNPFVHFLSLPRLGYVKEPLRGYSLNTFTTPTFPSIQQLKEDPFQYLLFLWAQNRFMGLALASSESEGRKIRGIGVPFPEGRSDLSMVFRDETFGPLLAYYRVWPANLSADDIRNTYLAELLGGDAFMEVARRAFEAGEIRAALTVYQQVQLSDPNNAEAYARAGAMQFILGDPKAAQQEYQRALAIDPTQPIAHNGLGALAAQREDYEAAEGHFSRAADSLQNEEAQDPVLLGETYRNWGLSLWKGGKPGPAMVRLEKAVAVQPEYLSAYRDLGQLALQQGALARAEVAFRKVRELDPQDDAALLGIAIAEARGGKSEKARETLGRIATRDPGLLYQCGVIKEEILGAPREAEAAYGLALRQLEGAGNPELLANIHLRRGNLRLRRQDVAGAIEDFRKVLQSQPSSLDAANNLAWVLATYPDESVRNSTEAVSLAERVRDLAGAAKPGHLDTLAAAYARNGDWELAVQTADRAAAAAQAEGNQPLAAAIRARQKLYERRQPYEEPLERKAP